MSSKQKKVSRHATSPRRPVSAPPPQQQQQTGVDKNINTNNNNNNNNVPQEIYFRGIPSGSSLSLAQEGHGDEGQQQQQQQRRLGFGTGATLDDDDDDDDSVSSQILKNAKWITSGDDDNDDKEEEEVGGKDTDYLDLTQEMQEKLLIAELLYVLRGYDGEVISFKPDGSYRFGFNVKPFIQHSLRDLSLQIAQLGAYYKAVNLFEEEYINITSGQMKNKRGRVNEALGAAIRDDVEKDYMIQIGQLERMMLKDNLSLHSLFFYIQPTLRTFAVLNSIVVEIREEALTGAAVLSVLHKKAKEMMMDDALSPLCSSLAHKASIPYFAMLEAWIYKGMIRDPSEEFMVTDCFAGGVKATSSLDDNFWEKRYLVDEGKCPIFLKKKMDKILKTGKYLNVIRGTGKDIQVDSATKIDYNLYEREYAAVIDNAFSFASKTLLDLLMNENDLRGRLLSVKHCLLMDQGDFIVQFLDLSESELSKPADSINMAKLGVQLDVALRTSKSSLSADPYKDNVGVQLLPYGISDQVSVIMSIETPMEAESMMTFENIKSVTASGIEVVTLTYDVQWPVSLVLNKRAMTCYQMIFRQLLYCKHVERQLCKVWIDNKGMKNRKLEKRGMDQIYVLRQKMLHFVQNIQYYMAFEVVEPAWHKFFENLSKITNVDDVFSSHTELLDSILADSMLIHRAALWKMADLLRICAKFAEIMQSSTEVLQKKGVSLKLEASLKQISASFNDKLMKFLQEVFQMVQDPNLSSNVANVLHRLNFNGFYTEALEELQD